ncbi:MAG: hypothetical protein KZQ89_19475 [Candidatus Thiodiazotropha sp. (ex Lucinoma kastoroae)]|nr:hypothetical protein [Candidatus Thiodiazotropha sp. (ex Lucinoma kastoroae)]
MQGSTLRSPFAFFSLVITILWLNCFPSLVHANDQMNALWIAESSGVIKVATADGTVLLEIEGAGDTQAVAVDQQRALLWVFGGDTLRAYGVDGLLQSQTQVGSLNSAGGHSTCEDDAPLVLDEENESDANSIVMTGTSQKKESGRSTWLSMTMMAASG